MKKEIEKQINELKEKGKRPFEISKILKIPYATTLYHYSESNRKSMIERNTEYQKTNKPERGDEYRKYQKEFHRKWYQKNKERLKIKRKLQLSKEVKN